MKGKICLNGTVYDRVKLCLNSITMTSIKTINMEHFLKENAATAISNF